MGIDDSFHKGLKAYREGKYQEAVQLLYSAVSDNEENHKAWNALGVTLSKMGRLEEAVTCYENALKYDPGNTSYEQNRDQIVQKAFSKIPRSPELERPPQTPINYQRFIIPSILLILVALIAVYILFISSFLGGASESQQAPPLSTPVIIPVETPEPIQEIENTSLSSVNNSEKDNTLSPPVEKPSSPASSLVFIGDLTGKYFNGLSEVTFTIGIPEGGIPQYTPRMNYFWSAGNLDPIPVLPANPGSGTMKPGESQIVTLQLPINQQPRAGEKFSIEVRPPSGTPVIVKTFLPEDYSGGAIKNPIAVPSAGDEQKGSQGSSASPGSEPNLVLDGSLSGFYTSELEQLTLTLRGVPTGTAQDLTRITYSLGIGSGTPEPITRVNPSSGSINPGEQQLLTLTIPEGNRPRAGESFILVIKPEIGSALTEMKTLSSAYKGGIIP